MRMIPCSLVFFRSYSVLSWLVKMSLAFSVSTFYNFFCSSAIKLANSSDFVPVTLWNSSI